MVETVIESNIQNVLREVKVTDQIKNLIADEFTKLERLEKNSLFLQFFNQCPKLSEDQKINFHLIIGQIYQKMAKYVKALEQYFKSLEYQKKQSLINYIRMSDTLNFIGDSQRRLGQNDEAEKCFQESFDLKKKVVKDEDDFQFVKNYQKLGDSFISKGNYNKSLELYQKAYDISCNAHESQPTIDKVKSLFKISVVYKNLMKYTQAKEYSYFTLDMAFSVVHPQHNLILEIQHNIGWLDWYQKNYEIALDIFEYVLKIRKLNFGEISHPDIAETYNTIGLSYIQLNKIPIISKRIQQQLQFQDQQNNLQKEGVKLCEKSLDIMKKIFNKQKKPHPSYNFFQKNLKVYDKVGDKKKALDSYLESIEQLQQIYKEDHPMKSKALNNCGTIFFANQEYEKSIQYYEESLQNYKAEKGEILNSKASCLRNIGLAYFNLYKDDKGIEYFLKSAEMHLESQGEGNPQSVEAYDLLLKIIKDNEHYAKLVIKIKHQLRSTKSKIILIYQSQNLYKHLLKIRFFRAQQVSNEILNMYPIVSQLIEIKDDNV